MSLRPGLTQEQVIERLGPPLARTRKPGDHIPGVEDEPVESIVLTYGEPGLLGGGFELSVLLHDGRLVSAGCEVYDLGIYRCDRRECPVIWDEHALDRLPADD